MTEHRIDLTQLAKVRDGSGHSIFGASGSAMFLNCTGSLIPNLLQPDDAGEDAAYGTVAHAVGEMWRRKGVMPAHLIGSNMFIESGEWGYLIDIDESMMEYVQQSIDWSDFLPGKHFAEQHVDYSVLTPIPNQGGTLDFAALRYQHATVQDEKYGKNETIYAKENTQLMMYAFGLFLEWDWLYDFREFVLRISQPRLAHFDEWTLTRAQLLEFAEWAKGRMHEAWRLDAPRTAGVKQCKFCRVRASCAANAKMQEDLVSAAFENIGQEISVEDMAAFKRRLDDSLDVYALRPVEIGTLTTAQMARLTPFRGTAERWWAALDVELLRRYAAGEDLTPYGLKPVESRSRRKFISDVLATRRLEQNGVPFDEITKTSMVSVAQAEKLLIRAGHRRKDLPDLLRDLVRKPPGKATLVPLADRRPTLVDVTEAAFADLSETTEDRDYEEE